jgi:lambda repressor-like predicted transcriptional regulator
MHHADIKAALQKKGYTQSQVAAMATRGKGHAHKSAVSRVIRGDLKSAALAQLIAKLIGMPISQIWPGKYPSLVHLEKTPPLSSRRASRKPAAV